MIGPHRSIQRLPLEYVRAFPLGGQLLQGARQLLPQVGDPILQMLYQKGLCRIRVSVGGCDLFQLWIADGGDRPVLSLVRSAVGNISYQEERFIGASARVSGSRRRVPPRALRECALGNGLH